MAEAVRNFLKDDERVSTFFVEGAVVLMVLGFVGAILAIYCLR